MDNTESAIGDGVVEEKNETVAERLERLEKELALKDEDLRACREELSSKDAEISSKDAELRACREELTSKDAELARMLSLDSSEPASTMAPPLRGRTSLPTLPGGVHGRGQSLGSSVEQQL